MNQFNVSLWGDEGFSAILSMKSLPEIIKIISHDTSPPLWNITEWLAFKIFGTGEIYIRGLAFFYYLLTGFFTYKIASFLFGKKTGILATCLTLLNPFFFTYAFEGRMYSILALGVTASFYYFLRILFSQGQIDKSIKYGYVVASLWALYSHHFAIFAFFIQGFWVVWEFIFGKRKIAREILKLFLFIALGYTPWIIPLYNQTRMVAGGFWLGTPNLKDLFGLGAEYLAAGIRNNSLTLPYTNIAIYKIALVTVLITFIIRKWFKNLRNSFFLLTWFIGPILITWLISQKFQSIFFNRYLLYTIPAAMLVLSSYRRKVSLFLIITTIFIFAKIDYYYFTHPFKPPFRELTNYIKQIKQPGDYYINWNSSAHHLWETKYYGIQAPIYIPENKELPFFVGTALMQKEDLISKIPNNTTRIGVITSGPIEEIYLPSYTESSIKTFDNLKFVLYVKN